MASLRGREPRLAPRIIKTVTWLPLKLTPGLPATVPMLALAST